MRLPLLLLLAVPISATSLLGADEAKPAPLPPAKEGEGPKAPDPSDAYFQGWLLSKDAEGLRKKGMNQEAEKKMVQALLIFRGVRHQWPEWKKEMVRGRLVQTEETLRSWGWKEEATI